MTHRLSTCCTDNRLAHFLDVWPAVPKGGFGAQRRLRFAESAVKMPQSLENGHAWRESREPSGAAPERKRLVLNGFSQEFLNGIAAKDEETMKRVGPMQVTHRLQELPGLLPEAPALWSEPGERSGLGALDPS